MKIEDFNKAKTAIEDTQRAYELICNGREKDAVIALSNAIMMRLEQVHAFMSVACTPNDENSAFLNNQINNLNSIMEALKKLELK